MGDQLIVCPICQGLGWRREAGRPNDWYECPVCDRRGDLVIDGKKTLEGPAKKRPLSNIKQQDEK